MTMKAVTVQQPYASAIFRLGKDIENRGWVSNHRGLLAIHAGLQYAGPDAMSKIRSICDGARALDGFFKHAMMNRGVIIGVVDLAGAYRLKDHNAAEFGRWATGPVCWKLQRPRELPHPIVQLGAQQLWTVPEPHERLIMAQLDELRARAAS